MNKERLETAGHWLIRLQEDSLTEAEMAEWAEWCESDPQNLQAFEYLQSLWRVAGDHMPRRREALWHSRIPVWAALAASILLTIIGGAVFLAGGKWWTESRIADRELVQTPIATNRQAVLPDGSRIDLGARTAVTVNFEGPRRLLQLRDGEAFFQVKHDKTRPFVVEVEGLQIVAVGTAFNVRRTGATVAVTVQEGIVEVRKKPGDTRSPAPARAVQARAGEQLVFDSRSGEIQESLIDPAVALAWRSGRLEFTGDSLDAVVASVNRYSERPIVLGDPRLGELSFTGTVFFSSIDCWLNGLQQVFPITVNRSGSGEIVLNPRTDSQ